MSEYTVALPGDHAPAARRPRPPGMPRPLDLEEPASERREPRPVEQELPHGDLPLPRIAPGPLREVARPPARRDRAEPSPARGASRPSWSRRPSRRRPGRRARWGSPRWPLPERQLPVALEMTSRPCRPTASTAPDAAESAMAARMIESSAAGMRRIHSDAAGSAVRSAAPGDALAGRRRCPRRPAGRRPCARRSARPTSSRSRPWPIGVVRRKRDRETSRDRLLAEERRERGPLGDVAVAPATR